MTDAFRQKLLNFLCSMLVVLLLISGSALVAWFVAAPRMLAQPYGGAYLTAWMMGEAFIVYAALAPPSLIWHLSNFLWSGKAKPGWAGWLFAYPVFLAALGITGFAWILASSGSFTYQDCPDLDGAFFYSCPIVISPWVMIPLYLGLVSLLILCVVQASMAIRFIMNNRFGRRQRDPGSGAGVTVRRAGKQH